MNLTLEAIRILDTIDRKGGFGAAAVALDRVPSALTYSVRKLEDDLDVLLFDRRGHRAKLTAAGRELLEEGRHLLRAADELEQRVKRTATGWEVELRIVLDALIPFERMLPLIAEYDAQAAGTQLRFATEVLSGTWDRLVSGEADLAIGVAYDGPDLVRGSGGFRVRPLGEIDWVFAVAPGHPLAALDEPLPAAVVRQHRAIATGDTGRMLPTVTSGLLTGQPTLTVPGMHDKLQAQLAGLGCGHLPRSWVQPYLDDGTLIEKRTDETKPDGTLRYAWRNDARGKCLKWFLNKLADPGVQHSLLG
ncbi:LysR family transcriptional regulator [Oxalicibacterium flavum]|uniref:LysR family transcriptional regulator n=1 Tax=Oxalicibacterium flavum TaxID=179467 RepID=A0A8J2XZS0_9BURK|nr:LysR family transcriptional regulator [Oxalicibacterium flavum]GGC14627.1 LysR family transcriptional regulator [Oxalicibacterium flavum]